MAAASSTVVVMTTPHVTANQKSTLSVASAYNARESCGTTVQRNQAIASARIRRSPHPSIPQRQRDEAERADDDAPPGEQRKAVALHVVEEGLHHDPGGDERHRKAERDQDAVVEAHLAAALVEVVDE